MEDLNSSEKMTRQICAGQSNLLISSRRRVMENKATKRGGGESFVYGGLSLTTKNGNCGGAQQKMRGR